MKLLLLSPPYLPQYMRNARCDYVSISHTQWYPIWLSYCGALLEKHGHQVKLIDAPAERLTHEAALKASVEFAPEWVVVYSSTKSQDNDVRFAEQIKEQTGGRLVFVGPYVSIDPAAILQQSNTLDCAVKGEFDFPVLEVVEGEPFARVRNLLYKKDGKIVQNEPRPLLSTKELDELPFVTEFYRRHLDLRNYQVPQELYPFVDLFTGRGCVWGHCTFCLWVHSFIPGEVYNTRSIGNVIEEIKFVKREIPEAKEVFIQDDTLPADRARELSQAILDAGPNITWGCYLRGNVDYETMKLMKKAGCRTVHVGYESANDSILKSIRKGLTTRIMTRFTEDAARAGLLVHGDFMLGLPGETEETIKATIRWAKELPLATAQFGLMNPYPTTPFYDYLESNGYLKDGEPNYPHLSSDEIHWWAKRAYAEFYFRWRYLKEVIRHPRDRFFSQLRPIYEMSHAIFWRRW